MQVESQFSIFFTTVITGIVLGFLFDFYRVLRGTFRVQGFVTWVTDLLYWLVATAVVFIALVLSNWGELRFYVFLGIVGGVILYYRLISTYIIRLLAGCMKLANRTAALIKKILLLAVIRPVALCIRIIRWPFQFIGEKIKSWYQTRFPESPIDEKK